MKLFERAGFVSYLHFELKFQIISVSPIVTLTVT